MPSHLSSDSWAICRPAGRNLLSSSVFLSLEAAGPEEEVEDAEEDEEPAVIEQGRTEEEEEEEEEEEAEEESELEEDEEEAVRGAVTDDQGSDGGAPSGGGRGGGLPGLLSKENFSGVPRVPKWRPSSGSSPTRPFHLLLIPLCVLLRSPLFSLLLSLLPKIAGRLRLPLLVLPTLSSWGNSFGET